MEQTPDDRFRVQRALATVHGEEIAALCMDLMPNVDTTQLSTREDVETAVVLVRKDMDHGFSELRAEIRAGFAEQGKSLAEQISSSVNQSLRWSIVTMVSMQAVLVAAIRLL